MILLKLCRLDLSIDSLVRDEKICSKDYFKMKKNIVNKAMHIFYDSDSDSNLDKAENIRKIINSRNCERKANLYVEEKIMKYRLMKFCLIVENDLEN
jgi:tagatose-1,6-bisphosphate aldolase